MPYRLVQVRSVLSEAIVGFGTHLNSQKNHYYHQDIGEKIRLDDRKIPANAEYQNRIELGNPMKRMVLRRAGGLLCI